MAPSENHGQFAWCELMTTDPLASVDFYRDVIGWTATAVGPLHPDYTVMSAGDVGIAGIATLPQHLRDAGVPAFWMGYIAVDDVDAAAAQVTEAGGAVHRPPGEIEGIGRFAVVADPHGAVFTLFKPHPGTPPPPRRPPTTPGHVGWHELHAGDREAAFSFYANLFGWTKTEATDLGPMGLYQTFTTGGASGPAMTGGMMTKPDMLPRPVWFHYFTVPEIDAAVARTRAAGGDVTMGPHEVPGGSWIAHGKDPQGVFFAMIAPPGSRKP